MLLVFLLKQDYFLSSIPVLVDFSVAYFRVKIPKHMGKHNLFESEVLKGCTHIGLQNPQGLV